MRGTDHAFTSISGGSHRSGCSPVAGEYLHSDGRLHQVDPERCRGDCHCRMDLECHWAPSLSDERSYRAFRHVGDRKKPQGRELRSTGRNKDSDRVWAPAAKKRIAHELMAMEATHMKAVQLIGTGTLFLLLGTVAPAYAQEEAKPAKQEEKAQPAKQEAKATPAKQEEKAQPAKQEAKATPAKQEEKAQPAKQEAKATPAKQEEKAQPAKQEAKATPAKQEEKAQPAKQEEHAKAAPQERGQPQRTQQAQ